MGDCLPLMITYPPAAWRSALNPKEWQACLDAWIALAEAHLALTDDKFRRISATDGSLSSFIRSYLLQNDNHPSLVRPPVQDELSRVRQLHKDVYLLIYRLLDNSMHLDLFSRWDILASISRLYTQGLACKLIDKAWACDSVSLGQSLSTLRSTLIGQLESKVDGKLELDKKLRQLNYLLHTSPQTAQIFMAGTDFFDALISRYKIMNPPLRKIIVSTTFLCLIGLTKGETPNFTVLIDQLYNVKTAAEIHKAGPASAKDSLVDEVLSTTPILKHLRRRIRLNEAAYGRAEPVLGALESLRKSGGKRKSTENHQRNELGEKGKASRYPSVASDTLKILHVHRQSLISQVRDLFPDLGSGFVAKLLDEYDDSTETVISHLLEESLPPYLQTADRSESLYVLETSSSVHLKPCVGCV